MSELPHYDYDAQETLSAMIDADNIERLRGTLADARHPLALREILADQRQVEAVRMLGYDAPEQLEELAELTLDALHRIGFDIYDETDERMIDLTSAVTVIHDELQPNTPGGAMPFIEAFARVAQAIDLGEMDASLVEPQGVVRSNLTHELRAWVDKNQRFPPQDIVGHRHISRNSQKDSRFWRYKVVGEQLAFARSPGLGWRSGMSTIRNSHYPSRPEIELRIPTGKLTTNAVETILDRKLGIDEPTPSMVTVQSTRRMNRFDTPAGDVADFLEHGFANRTTLAETGPAPDPRWVFAD